MKSQSDRKTVRRPAKKPARRTGTGLRAFVPYSVELVTVQPAQLPVKHYIYVYRNGELYAIELHKEHPPTKTSHIGIYGLHWTITKAKSDKAITEVLVERQCKHGKNICDQMQYTHAIKLVILNEAGVISDFEFRMLNAMRAVRNKAAHAGNFTLTPKLLKPFAEMNRKDPPYDYSETDSFFNLCVELVFMFWNTHSGVFTQYFDPEYGKKISLR